MNGIIENISNWFWNPRFWLPANTTWDDLKNSAYTQYPQFSDLYFPFILACGFLILRYVFERLIVYPLGHLLKLKDNKAEIVKLKQHYSYNSEVLEKFFIHYRPKIKLIITKNSSESNPIPNISKNGLTKHRNIKVTSTKNLNGVTCNGDNLIKYLDFSKNIEQDLTNLSFQTSYSIGTILNYLRKRHNLDRPGKLVKFGECSWRFVYYLSTFIYGLVILHDKPWFWKTSECWTNYPFQPISRGIWWYYMIEMGFYWSLMASQFVDVKRKDFWQMFVHHVCALLLLTFSFVCNMVRIGTLVLIIHDTVDYWLEAFKIAHYLKRPTLSTTLFSIFTVIWFLTRIVLFPYRVVYPAVFEAHLILKSFFAAYYVYNVLLLLLQALNLAWFYIICVMVYKSIRYGEIKKDERSSSEESDDYGDDIITKTQQNGMANKKEF